MFKKISLFISTLLISLKLSFAEGLDLAKTFDIFGNFYKLLKEQPQILDGIAVIIFFIGSFQIFNNIFSKVFKGSGNAQARKGISIILSLFITGGLVIHNPGDGFVSYYGGILLFYIGVLMLFALYFPWAKKVWNRNKENRAKAIFLISMASLFLIFALESLALKLFDNNAKNAFTWQFLNILKNLNPYIILVILISLLMMIIKFNKNSVTASEILIQMKKNKENSYIKIIKELKQNYGVGSSTIKNLWGLYNK